MKIVEMKSGHFAIQVVRFPIRRFVNLKTGRYFFTHTIFSNPDDYEECLGTYRECLEFIYKRKLKK